nr:hypothetical protein BaRGS_021623 [Batillaria attramentaria]
MTTHDMAGPNIRYTIKQMMKAESDVAALAVSLEDRCAAPGVDVEVLVDSYNYGLREILDRHAPSVTRRVRDRASAPWLSAEVMEARRRRRRAERLWRKTHLTVHRQIFTQQRAAAKSCLLAAKTQFYHDRIESAVSSKQLFAVSSELLGKSKTKVLPTDVPGDKLPQRFCDYFSDKISDLRSRLDATPCDPPSFATCKGIGAWACTVHSVLPAPI